MREPEPTKRNEVQNEPRSETKKTRSENEVRNEVKRGQNEVKTTPLVLSSFLFSVSLRGSHSDIAVHVGPEFDELCGRLGAIFLLRPCGLAAPVSPAKPADPGQAGQFDSLSKAPGTWKSCSTAPKYKEIRGPKAPRQRQSKCPCSHWF